MFHVKQLHAGNYERRGEHLLRRSRPMSSSTSYLLIGGYAASHAARAIRERDAAGQITLVNAEKWAPYERPPLSKALLFDLDYSPAETLTVPAEFYRQHDITLKLGVRATDINREKREVTLDNGEVLSYDKLLLAPGSGAKKPEFEGGDFSNVHVIRTLDDSLKLREALGQAENVAVVGGSYLGLEAASGALKRGATPTIIGSHQGPWSKFASPALQKFVSDEFERAGARFVWNQRVEKVLGDDRASAVQTASGPIETDLIVAAIGAQLHTGLAEKAGLEVHPKHGILVDKTLRTADPHIWVAGDCAAYPEAFVGTLWHNEHYRNAEWQGTLAGANMASAPDEAQEFSRAPYFFSDVLDWYMILRGNPAGGQSARVLGDMTAGEFVELYADDEGLVKMAVAISHDKPKTRVIADKLEPLLWSEQKVGEYSAEQLGL